MRASRLCICLASLAAVASGFVVNLPAQQADFAAAVTATHPIAYYALDATSGKSLVGASTYAAKGGVTSGSGDAGIAGSSGNFLQFNGKSGYVLTTQMGGVGKSASIMAWVNLAELPNKAGHYFYVAGESENGNDLDLQFENDNVLRFFTASGGNLAYTPAPASLVGQWHMILVTMDLALRARTIYWDGKLVAHDAGGGEAGKKAAFSIGASTVFGGRWLHGGVEEVALWDHALKKVWNRNVGNSFPCNAEGGGVGCALDSRTKPALAAGFRRVRGRRFGLLRS
jgi:Concanavalin A-like lectin/glucanases superfamily